MFKVRKAHSDDVERLPPLPDATADDAVKGRS
jgi:hypothetical protein